MYRKYVRKWWLLKRNRIICPEVAVNGQFLPGKSNNFLNCLKLFLKLPPKSENIWKFAWKNRNLFDPDPRPPDLKPDWRRCKVHVQCIVSTADTTDCMNWRMFETPVSYPASGPVVWPMDWPSAPTVGRWPCVEDWRGTARVTACHWGRRASWPSLYRDVTAGGGWKACTPKARATCPAFILTCYLSKKVLYQYYHLDSLQRSTISVDLLAYWISVKSGVAYCND